MKAMLAVILSGCLVAGCDDGAQRKAEQEKAEKEKMESAKRAEKSRAEREAEARLMADVNTAEPAISKRLSDWISVREGLLIVRGHQSTSRRAFRTPQPWFSMPSGTAWFVNCDAGGLHVTLGPWADVSGGTGGNDVSTESMFSLEISNARLSEDQCKELVVIAGRKMREITSP